MLYKEVHMLYHRFFYYRYFNKFHLKSYIFNVYAEEKLETAAVEESLHPGGDFPGLREWGVRPYWF